MKPRTLLLAWAALSCAHAGAPPEVLDLTDAPPSTRLSEPSQGLVLELTVEPVAGQTLEGGGFTVEFLPTLPSPPASVGVFADGFETP